MHIEDENILFVFVVVSIEGVVLVIYSSYNYS